MNILYYNWNENSSEDIKSLFEESGYTYSEISHTLANYDNDPELEKVFEEQLQSQSFDFIFTFNYFPVLSNIAQKISIPYVSWIYDCPHLTLYSKTITNSCNFLFLFDRSMHAQAVSLGAVHAFHLPLAVNTRRLNAQLFLPVGEDNFSFEHEVSFVGSLYEKNMYRQINYLPNHLRGYLDGLINAQQKIWGYCFFDNLLTIDILNEMNKYILTEENPYYSFTSKTIFTNLLNTEVTCRERAQLLENVSGDFSTDIYSASTLDHISHCHPHGFISYTSEMPQVFCSSKINLNITLRSIHSGIPLRCLDIMGAGGFLLSNYQPELAELFVPGEEFIYYESDNDLLEKVNYFLTHDKERMEIARKGWKKIQTHFSYPVQFGKIIRRLKTYSSIL